jgi:hypothetical protein
MSTVIPHPSTFSHRSRAGTAQRSDPSETSRRRRCDLLERGTHRDAVSSCFFIVRRPVAEHREHGAAGRHGLEAAAQGAARAAFRQASIDTVRTATPSVSLIAPTIES